MKNLEEKVAETLLQEVRSVKVDGKLYDVPDPTLGTLVMVSGVVSKMSVVGSRDNVTMSALARSGDAPLVAEAIATIILGAKEIKKRWRWYVVPHSGRKRLERLKMRILNSYTPEEALRVLIGLFNGMQLGVFFELTTFLSEANVMKETKVVKEEGTGATALGRS